MRSTLAARISGLFREMLGHSGWLRSELRRLDQGGQGHPCMRALCEQLDSLDTSIVWDLRDEIKELTVPSAPSAERILDWLRTDVNPLVELVCRLDRECPGHPLVSAAIVASGDIVGLFRELEQILVPARLPATTGPVASQRPSWQAAERPRIC
jgi:hypothetical protein